MPHLPTLLRFLILVFSGLASGIACSQGFPSRALSLVLPWPAGVAADTHEPLRSTKPYGLGVGLSLSRSIIEAHGGQLTFANHGGGAVVRFTLPTAEGAH